MTLPASILGFVSSLFRKHNSGSGCGAELCQLEARPGMYSDRCHGDFAGRDLRINRCDAAGGADEAIGRHGRRASTGFPGSISMRPCRQPDNGPLVTRSYDLTDVLARIDADASLTPDAGPGLKWMIEMVLQINLQVPRKRVCRRHLHEQATHWMTALTVVAPESLQDLLAEQLNIWQQSGFGQIAVGCEFVTADHDIASALESPGSCRNRFRSSRN